MQRFESLQQYQQTKVNQVKQPPNLKSQDQKSEINLNTKLKNQKILKLGLQNRKLKNSKSRKRLNQYFMKFLQNLSNYLGIVKIDEIEKQQYLYGGFTLKKLPYGVGIMMEKPQVLFMRDSLKKDNFYMGQYQNQMQLRNYKKILETNMQKIKLIMDTGNQFGLKIRITGLFDIENQHHGTTIFRLICQAKRWKLKENWLDIFGFYQSVKSGNGQIFKSYSHNEFQLKFDGEFSNNQFHCIGTYHHNKY